MWYGNTKNLLESTVRSLKTEPPQDDAEWHAQTELVQACLAEMVEMSEPTVNPSMGATSRYVHRPVADKLNRAMPHVRSMLTADRKSTRLNSSHLGISCAVFCLKKKKTRADASSRRRGRRRRSCSRLQRLHV